MPAAAQQTCQGSQPLFGAALLLLLLLPLHLYLPGMSWGANRDLQQHLEATAAACSTSSSYARLQAQRAELPAAAVRGECLQLLQQHQVGVHWTQYRFSACIEH